MPFGYKNGGKPASTEEVEAYEELYHFLPPHGRASAIKPDEHLK